MLEPTKVADQYNHKSFIIPENIAGANERTGFIEAPEIKDRKKMSNPTMPPMAIPLKFLNPFAYTTTKITPIRRDVAKTSTLKIRGIEKDRFVVFAPRLASVPIKYFTKRLPSKAPTTCAIK